MADDIDAFLVRRDDEGNIQPYEVEVLGDRESPLTIEILPTTVGSLKGLSDPNGDAVKWPIEDKIRYVREHVVNPDFGALSVEEIEDRMTMFDLDMLLVTAVIRGGPGREKKGKKKGPRKRSGPSRKRSRS